MPIITEKPNNILEKRNLLSDTLLQDIAILEKRRGYQSVGFLTDNGFTDNGDGTLSVNENSVLLYNSTSGDALLYQYIIGQTTFSNLLDGINYIYANNTGTSVVYNTTQNYEDIDFKTSCPYLIVFKQGTNLQIYKYPFFASNFNGKLLQKIIEDDFVKIVGDYSISEINEREITISDITIWYGLEKRVLTGFSTDTISIINYYHSSGNWITSNLNSVDNTSYDNGTDLVALNDGEYGVYWLYRDLEKQQLYLLYGKESYANVNDAIISEPYAYSELPEKLQKVSFLIGKAIVLKGNTNINYLIKYKDAFDVLKHYLDISVNFENYMKKSDYDVDGDGIVDNADTVDGFHANTTPIPNSLLVLDNNGDLPTNALTASKLQTAKTISITGSQTGSTTFDGSTDVSISLTNNVEQLLSDLKTVDGSGSGLDADTVDGFHASQEPIENQIPVLNSDKQFNLPFSQAPIKVGGQDYMNRTFYVDQNNGDDSNDGTQSNPFKSLNKAIACVPIGGYGKIILLSDYTLDSDVYFLNKNILIDGNGRQFSITTKEHTITVNETNYDVIYSIHVGNGSLIFKYMNNIIVPSHSGSNTIFTNLNSLVSLQYGVSGFGFIGVFYTNNIEINTGFSFIDTNNNGGGYGLITFQAWGVKITKNDTGVLIKLDNTNLIMGKCYATLVDGSGNTLKWNDMISGISYINGIITNVLSTLTDIGYPIVFSSNNVIQSTHYVKFPNGLIIQWGNVTNGANPVSVTFPIAFPNARFILLATPNRDYDASTDPWFVVDDSTIDGVDEKSGASLHSFNYDGSDHTSTIDQIYWIAIGY